MEWQQVRLGDYISIKSGLAYQGSKIGRGDSILLGMGCVSYKDKFVESGARPYDDVCDDRYTVKPGDLVLATRQQSDNLPILAMPAVIPDKYKDKRVIFGTNLYKVDNQSEISSRFLYWLFKHQHYVNYIAGVKSGTAVQMVTKKNVEDYKFLCPSKEERERIASILSTYDSLIENNTRRIRLLEQMAENLYKEWFVRFRFPGHETCKMLDGIPEGWKYEKFGKLCPIVTGKKDANFASPNGSYKFFTCSKDDLLADSYSFDCFAIILAGNGDLNVKLYKGKFEAYQRTYVLSPYSLDNIFTGFYTIQAELDRLLVGAAGAVIKFLTKGMIENIKVIIPTDDVLSSFNSFMMNNYEERQKLILSSASLARQRDLLLPRLMSGQIEINE